MKVAIIGAGAAGSSAARFLSQAGHGVHVYEQYHVGHSQGSSHGTSRIARRTYPDPFYTALMDEAFVLWSELEDQAGEQLYFETGLLTFGPESSVWLQRCRQSLRENHQPFDEFGPLDAARRLGGFHLEPGEVGIFESGAGYLAADKIIAANLRLARGAGAEIFENTKANLYPDGVVNGEKYDGVAICAGAWTARLAPVHLEPRLQHFAYFEAPTSPFIPAWIDSGDDHYYGLPNYGRGFKVGRHLYGAHLDPNEVARPIDDNAVRAISEAARLRLGAREEPNEICACLYAVTPNEDFLIGKLDWHVPAFYASACSGHGFKFSVWVGKLMLDLFEGARSTTDYPRFCE